MTQIHSSMRIKIHADTLYLPDEKGGVYFRNNTSSFRIEGRKMIRWIEKLFPVLNGEYTLENLTDGLPDAYRERVYGIAEILYKNGFARDVSQDHKHTLSAQILTKYAPQIGFLDHFISSGAYHFQSYRQSKVLAVGSGALLISAVNSLFESGYPKVHALITEGSFAQRQRLMELTKQAQQTDSDISFEEITMKNTHENSWRKAFQPFETILYVSDHSNIEELRLLHEICREEKKNFLPAFCLQQFGLVGPLVEPDSPACWESAYHRIHQSTLSKKFSSQSFPPIACAMLSNVAIFELFKNITGIKTTETNHSFYMLDTEKMEGNWHSFFPHPVVMNPTKTLFMDHSPLVNTQKVNEAKVPDLLSTFSMLTSKTSGIFHSWGPADLKQLPLAQCRIQVVNALSDGPAKLLPEVVCSGMTHEEAQREAGLCGVESYVFSMMKWFVNTLPSEAQKGMNPNLLPHMIAVGVGETVVEGLCRGLEKYLTQKLDQQQKEIAPFSLVHLQNIADERCRFYLQSLVTMQGEPLIGFSKVNGFPVFWIQTNERWYQGVGLHVTTALRNALQQALLHASLQSHSPQTQLLRISSLSIDKKTKKQLIIPNLEPVTKVEMWQSALQTIKEHGNLLFLLDLAVEPFLQEKFASVFGVWLQEEVSS